MALSLATLQGSNFQPIVAPDPLKKYKTIADIQATQQEAQLRSTQIQAQQKALADASKIADILQQSGGQLDENTVNAITAIHPEMGVALRKTLQQEAYDRAKAMEGEQAPEMTAAGPQTQQAPIGDSLTDPNSVSAPAPAPVPNQAVALPLPKVQVPFGGPALQPKSQQNVFEQFKAQESYKKQAESEAKIAEAAAAAAEKRNPAGQKLGPGDVLLGSDAKPVFTNPPIPKSQTEYDQQLAAFNGDKSMTAKYGEGPMGLIKMHAAQAVETAKAGAQAREDVKKSDDPRLANVDPRFHEKVLDDVQKAESAYIAAQKAANDMAGTITGAKAGNKVAAQYSPVLGVLTINAGQGVKRINKQEIEQYQGAGSLFDRIAGWAGKQVEGQPIRKKILDDMSSLTQILTANSKTQRDRTLQSIDNTYRSGFSTVAPAKGSLVVPGGALEKLLGGK